MTLPTDFQYLSTPFPLQQSIRPLKNHNLVTIDHLKGTIKIHRVLQDFTMMRLISDQKVVAFETAVQVLHYVFPTKARASIEGFEMVRKLGDQFYPHVLALLRRFDEQKINVKLSPELYMLIQNLFWSE